jgi:septal ring factor EnvC (AmiA/AmiB activator)
MTAYQETGSYQDRLWVALLTVRARAGEEVDTKTLELLGEAPPCGPSDAEGACVLEALLRSVIEERIEVARQLGQAEERLDLAEATARELEAGLTTERKRAKSLGMRLDQAAERARALDVQMEQERRQAEVLKQQIDRLKTIEKIIDRREEPKAKEAAR